MDVPRLLRGVDPAWLPLFDLDRLASIAAALGPSSSQLAPPPDLVFEAFRYAPPAAVAVVVVAQDPYPTPGDAQGLCFSVPRGARLPPALARIFSCLERAGLRPAASPRGGDLRPWAAQGVLLLNAALTTLAGARGAHLRLWGPFVDEFFRRFCAARAGPAPLHFLLWGGPARAFAPCAREHGHEVHEYTHPSPVGDNRLPAASRFRMCPHFERVNAALAAGGRRPICWDNGGDVVCFADGACSRNGQPGARASYAAVVVGAHFGRLVVRGEVRPVAYALADEAEPSRGIVGLPGTRAAPTNNRGELLAAAYALLALLRGRALGRVELVSDSNNTVQTLLSWLPSRLEAGTAASMKNFDLVMVAWRLYCQLREQAAAVTLTHVRAHRPPPPPTAAPREKLLWEGNRQADRHAGQVLEGPALRAEPAPEVLGGLPLALAPGASAPAAPRGGDPNLDGGRASDAD